MSTETEEAVAPIFTVITTNNNTPFAAYITIHYNDKGISDEGCMAPNSGPYTWNGSNYYVGGDIKIYANVKNGDDCNDPNNQYVTEIAQSIPHTMPVYTLNQGSDNFYWDSK